MGVKQWIGVDERLPKNNNDVIVWDKKQNCFREDYYSRTHGMPGWAKSRQDAISHWMHISAFNRMIQKTLKGLA